MNEVYHKNIQVKHEFDFLTMKYIEILTSLQRQTGSKEGYTYFGLKNNQLVPRAYLYPIHIQ